jgi:hypothetical protein
VREDEGAGAQVHESRACIVCLGESQREEREVDRQDGRAGAHQHAASERCHRRHDCLQRPSTIATSCRRTAAAEGLTASNANGARGQQLAAALRRQNRLRQVTHQSARVTQDASRVVNARRDTHQEWCPAQKDSVQGEPQRPVMRRAC